MSADLQETLESYANLFSSGDGPLTLRYAALRRFYYLLRDISAGKLLDNPETGSKLEEHLPRPLQVLSQLARNAFYIRSPLEMEKYLRHMLDQLHGEGDEERLWRRLPEARLLVLKGNDCLSLLRNGERGHFHGWIAPSLKLDLIEERMTETEITFAFIYGGKAPAFDVRLFYRGEGGLEVHAGELGQEQVRNGERFVKIGDGVSDGGICLGKLLLLHTGVLRCRLEYNNYLPQNTSLDDDEFDYVVEKSGGVPPSINHLNPFIPDGSIHSDDHWRKLALGRHPLVVERLVAELLGNSSPRAIRGLRRSGKTTVLLRLRQILNERPVFLAIHIKIREWWFELEKINRPIEGSGLLYEIAAATLRSAQELPGPSKCDKFLNLFEDNMAISLPDFTQFLRVFREEAGLKPVFLLDDLDFWLKKEQFIGDSWKLLIYLRDLTEQRLCSVVVAHTWTGDEWDERLYEQDIVPFGERLEMLDYPDVLKLLDLLPAIKTGMAKELVWRLTGGWQGLLQLFLYCLHEESLRSGRSDISLVKFVTGELLNSADWRPLVKYLVETFRRDEAEVLSHLVEQELVVAETSEILKIGFSPSDRTFDDSAIREGNASFAGALGSLKEKKIIEPFSLGQGKLRLRVGFLSYPPICELLNAYV